MSPEPWRVTIADLWGSIAAKAAREGEDQRTHDALRNRAILGEAHNIAQRMSSTQRRW